MPLKLPALRLLQNWASGWPKANQEGRKVKPITPQPAATRKTRKTGLASLKPEGGFFFFLSNSLFFYYLFFSFNFFFLSFLLSFLFLLLFFPFLSLLPYFFFCIFFKFSQKCNKTLNCEKYYSWTQTWGITTADTVRQISLCYSRELASYCIFPLLFLSLFLHLSFY